jgi:hypothetical protein
LRDLGVQQMGIGWDERTRELRLELFGDSALEAAIRKELPDVRSTSNPFRGHPAPSPPHVNPDIPRRRPVAGCVGEVPVRVFGRDCPFV